MVKVDTMGTTVDALLRSCQEEVASIVERLANPPPTAMSPHLGGLIPPVEDI
jgi:hypothetical protein